MSGYTEYAKVKCPLCGQQAEAEDQGECTPDPHDNNGRWVHSGSVSISCDTCGTLKVGEYDNKPYRIDIHDMVKHTRIGYVDWKAAQQIL